MLQPNTTTTEKLQKIGAVALSTATVSEQVRREVIEQRLPSHAWPERVLRISAIDTATGEYGLVSIGHPVSAWSTRLRPAALSLECGRR